jgi:hypothetical protein
MPTTQKSWQKPSLVVLVRTEPTEAVMQTCKSTTTPRWSGQSTWRNNCRNWTGSSCSGTCNTRRPS